MLTAYIQGIGLIGPGLADWPSGGAHTLRASSLTRRARRYVPAPHGLPPAERRRTGATVKLALSVAQQAVAAAGVDPAGLPTVFSSSGGDGLICHEICETLASSDRQLSPTRFHNSVHNAAAGYWSLATGATAASTALCAHDGSFAAGLLEALALVSADRVPVLLCAYDTGYPEPLHAKRPLPDSFAVALVLTPDAGPQCVARSSLRASAAPRQPPTGCASRSSRRCEPRCRRRAACRCCGFSRAASPAKWSSITWRAARAVEVLECR